MSGFLFLLGLLLGLGARVMSRRSTASLRSFVGISVTLAYLGAAFAFFGAAMAISTNL